MSKKIRTLPDLHSSLAMLSPGAKCEAQSVQVQAHDDRGKSSQEYFVGEIFILHPADGGDCMLIREQGATLLDVFIKCRTSLIRGIEERTRARRVDHAPAATDLRFAHEPLRLEYQP